MSHHQSSQDEVVFVGSLFSVRRQAVRHADGSESLYDIVDHPDAAAVVAIREESTGDESSEETGANLLVALVRQSRPAGAVRGALAAAARKPCPGRRIAKIGARFRVAQ